MKRTLSIILCIILALSLFCGCGRSAASMDKAESTVAVAPATPMEPEMEADMNYGYYEEPAEPAAPASGTNLGSSGLPKNTKLIYTAWLGLETTAFDESVAGLEELVEKMGGYFEVSQLNNYGTYRSGNYTVRVPAENFDAFCTAVGQLCQLNSIERSAEDISEAYYDTESRLVTQRTRLERLQTLLAQAESMEDIITLDAAISETEYNIEQLTGTLRKYDSLVGYSTVSISLQEVYELTEVEEPVIGFGAKLKEAFKRGSSNFVDSLQRTLLRFARNWAGWLIWIVIIALVVFFIVRGVRRRGGKLVPKSRRRSKKAPEEEKSDE